MWVLAQILTELTGKPRQKVVAGVDFQWSKQSHIANLFRVYELIFYRRYGIRASSSGYTRNEQGVVTTHQAFHSVEAALVACECFLRRLVPLPKAISIPVLWTPQGFPVFASPYLFAIAFDNSGGTTTTGNSTSTSLTTAGSNEIIFVGTFDAAVGVGNVSSTVNSNATTAIASSNQASTDLNQMELFYFVGTSAGAQTIAASTVASGGLLEVVFASYNGVGQTGQPDNKTTTVDDALTSKTISLNTVANNCWTVLIGRWQGQDINASTGSTKRQEPASGSLALFDSNAAKTPAGSTSMIITRVGGVNGGIGTVMASFSPVAGATTLPLLGIGT